MTTPREVLEAMVDHLDAGGELSVTSPLYAMHAELSLGDDAVSAALLDLATELEEGRPLDASHLYVAVARKSLGRVDEARRNVLREELRETLGAIAETLTPEAPTRTEGARVLQAGDVIELGFGQRGTVVASDGETASITFTPPPYAQVIDLGAALESAFTPGSAVAKAEPMAAIDTEWKPRRDVIVGQAPSILALPHGLHRGIPADVYHARILGMASKGALDLVHRSPAHYLAWINGAIDEESAALAFGSAYHMAALEPDRFTSEYIIEPTFKGKGSVAARAAWREEHAALSWIDADDARAIAEMVKTLRAHPLAAQLLERGEAEVTLRWADAATGIECRARADWFDEDRAICVDLKTTTDARPEPFTRSVASFQYHRQNALYADGFDAVDSWIDHFVFVAQEKAPPFAVSVFTLDDDAVKRGRKSIRRDLERLAECIERDEWPAYPDTIQEISMPRWAAE